MAASSLLALGIGLYLAPTVHLVTVALAGRLLGAQVEELRLQVLGGVTLREAAPRVRLGLLPGGYVRFVGADEPEAEGYERLAAWRRVVIPLTGPLVLLALAGALLGPGVALASAVAVPRQILAGLRPWAAAAAVLDAAALALAGPLPLAVGGVLAKVAAFNLLPLPSVAGGQALLVVLRLPERARMAATVVLTVGALVLFVGWAIALAAWLWA